MGISIFAEAIRRLYIKDKIDKEKIMELRKNGKLTTDEVNYILEAH